MGVIADELIEWKAANTMTDVEVIGSLLQEQDQGKEFVCGNDNYIWFYAIGRYFRPRTIVELGTRFGYSMKAFVDGAGHAPEEYSLWSYDLECDGIKTLHIFENYFRNQLNINDLHIFRSNTRELTTLDIVNQADLCLADAEHTVEGCYNECCIGYNSLRSGGVLVIDDIHNNDQKISADRFCEEYKLTFEYLPSFREAYVILKP